MKVKEVADLVGISVRTLHHYDAIGLLTPNTTDTGYRVYSHGDLEILQQILFFKALGFPLKEIKDIIYRPSFDQIEALNSHRDLLLEERRRIDKMLTTIDKTIKHKKGEIHMTDKEKFAGFNFNQNPYEKEARERYGDKKVDELNKEVKRLSKDRNEEFETKFNGIYQTLATVRHELPSSEIAQTEIKKWYDFLNTIGNYSPEAFKTLGQMYIEDERFKENIDQFGEGLAQFMQEAMAIYADRHKTY